MTIIYVDGYNVIFHCPPYKELCATDLEAARDMFIRRLAQYSGAIEGRVVLVFDGKNEYRASPDRIRHTTYLDVVFTTDRLSADVYIQRTLESAQSAERIVVTGDSALAAAVSTLGALAISPGMFMRHVAQAEHETVRAAAAAGRRPRRVRIEDLISEESHAQLLKLKGGPAADTSDAHKTGEQQRPPDG